MRYINTTPAGKYCSHARRMLGPAQRSPELPDLLNTLKSVLDTDKWLALELSSEELSRLDELLSRHFSAIRFDRSEVQKAIDDPGGLKDMALKEAAERSRKMKEYRDFVRADKEFEAMVAGETAEEKIEEVRRSGRLDVSAMDVKPGTKPRNLREAMALNAKLDLAREAGKG